MPLLILERQARQQPRSTAMAVIMAAGMLQLMSHPNARAAMVAIRAPERTPQRKQRRRGPGPQRLIESRYPSGCC